MKKIQLYPHELPENNQGTIFCFELELYNFSVTINVITTKSIFFFFTLFQFHFLSSTESGRADKMFHFRTCYVMCCYMNIY